MGLILYYISKEVSAFVSICALIVSITAFIVPRVNSRKQKETMPQKNNRQFQRLLNATDVALIIIAALALLIFISQLFFNLSGMEPVEVPLVEGKMYAEALDDLQSAKLQGKIICEDDPKDWSNYIVKEQQPAAGEMTLTKAKVKLVLVSAGIQPGESNRPDGVPDETPPIWPSIMVDAAPEFSDASVSPTYAVPGEEVTLNIRTSDYTFDLKLIDRNGDELPYEREDWGFFKFIMPDGDVTVYLGRTESLQPDIPAEPVLPGIVCSYGANCSMRYFSDLDSNAWYHEAVDFVVANFLLNGREGRFFPDGTVTRAEAATIFCQLTGWPDVIVFNDSFTDVVDDAWYAASVSWAVDSGIIAGYDDGTFRPDDLVTVEQFITILWRYAGFPVNDQPYLAFTDMDEISLYAMDAVEWAAGQGFLHFTNGTLNPQNYITRVEAAEILKNYIVN